jgi:TonB family protein
MTTKFFTFLLILISTITFGQPEKIFSIDYESQFDSGKQAFVNLILNNISFPEEARENGRQGTVVIGFTLTKDKRIIDIKVKNSVGMGCDEEAIRLLMLTEGKLKTKTNNNEYFEFLIKFIIADTKDVSKLISKADKLYLKENYKEALIVLDEIVRQSPYNLEILLKRGISRNKMGDLLGACADWTRIKELKESTADVYINEYCK